MALSRVKSDLIVKLDASKVVGALPALVGTNLLGVTAGGADQFSRNNLALNFFEDSVRDNMDRLSLSQGWVDTFEDASDVENFNVPMATFDGTNEYLNRSSGQGNMSNMVNGKECLFSCYYRSNQDGAGGGSDHDILVVGTNNHIVIRKDGHDSTNKLNVYLIDTPGNTLVGRYKNSKPITIADGVVHILVAVKMDAASVADRVKIIITTSDGVKHTTMEEITAASDSTLGFGVASPVIGGGGGGLSGSIGISGTRGSLGQVYFALEHMDITVNANYSKFYNTHASPKDFGTDGSLPTGNTPPIYLNNPYDTFHNNLGSGGNFNENGTLEDGGYIGSAGSVYDTTTESFTSSYELGYNYGKENSSVPALELNQLRTEGGVVVTLPNTNPITRVGFLMGKTGTPPSTDIYARIYGSTTGTIGTNGAPGGTIIGESIHRAGGSLITSNPGVYYFDFAEPVQLSQASIAIVVVQTGGSSANYNSLYHDTSSPTTQPNANSWYPDFVVGSSHESIVYVYQTKNLDLITKGSDDIGNSPATAPEKGHMEVLMTEQPASGTSVWTDTYDNNFAGMENTSTRLVLSNSSISAGGDRIRITIEGPTTGTEVTDYDNVAIVERSGSTANGTTTPTEILFGGTSGVVAPIGSSIASDWVDFTIDANKDYLVIFDMINDVSRGTARATTSGAAGYYQQATNTYNTISGPSGSIIAGVGLSITKLEVGVPQVVNTDYIAEMSRDGGTTYSPATLNRLKTRVGATNKNILGGAVDFAGDPSGTDIVGRVRTVNKDKITVHGVSVNWS